MTPDLAPELDELARALDEGWRLLERSASLPPEEAVRELAKAIEERIWLREKLLNQRAQWAAEALETTVHLSA